MQVYIGDGAMNNGQFLKLLICLSMEVTVLYIIENNKYMELQLTDKLDRCSKLTFGIPGEKVDGMNIFKVIEQIKQVNM